MKIKPFSILIIICICCLSTCTPEKIIPNDELLGKQFFPVATGKFIEYKYDSITLSKGGFQKDTSHGFLKMEIAEILKSTSAEIEYKLNRYWKRNAEDPWKLVFVDRIVSQNNRILESVGNLSFVKMIFPNNEGQSWNGNVLFDENLDVLVNGDPIKVYQGWNYEIISKGEIEKIGNEEIKALYVLQVDKELSLRKRYAIEKYGEGIGLVYREMEIYETQNFKPNQPWLTFAQAGFYLKQEMIAHN